METGRRHGGSVAWRRGRPRGGGQGGAPRGRGLSAGTQVRLSFHGSPRTFSYILRELPKVPTHVPVCVLGNYRDMGEHRVILPDDVRDLIDSLDRWVPAGSPQARCLGRAPEPAVLGLQGSLQPAPRPRLPRASFPALVTQGVGTQPEGTGWGPRRMAWRVLGDVGVGCV